MINSIIIPSAITEGIIILVLEGIVIMGENLRGKKGVGTFEVCLWWLVRVLLAVGVFTASTTPKKLMVLLALIFSFAVGLLKKIFSKDEFFSALSYHLQTCICLVGLLGSGLGFGFGLFQKTPEYDIPLSFFGGIVGTAIGYYISIAFRKPYKRKGFNFTAFMSFCISNAFIAVREIAQFFIDFYTGRNLIGCEFVGDDHWLIKLVGPMLSMNEHRYLYDYSEDITLGIIGALLATAVLYVNLRLKNKEAFIKHRKGMKEVKELSDNFIARCKDKIIYEADKVRQQTNLADMLLWWCVRVLMVYAFITIENKAEGVLLLVVSLGTVAITALHLVTPKDSMFCKINYRVQSLLCIIVFLGSYCGNYVGLYAYTGRFDTLLHFASGFISATAGYYIGLTLVKPLNKKENLALCLFALAFSMTVIPIHEMVEFFGDYIWGTTNQGFMWDPLPEDVMLYKIFGHGVGNTELLKMYDTMYDMVLATTSAVMSFVYMFFSLEKKRKSSGKTDYKTDTEKQLVSC